MIIKALKLGFSILIAVLIFRIVGAGMFYGLLKLIEYIDRGTIT